MSQHARILSHDTLRFLRRAATSELPSTRSCIAPRHLPRPRPRISHPRTYIASHRTRYYSTTQPSSTPSPENHYTLFPTSIPAGPPPSGPFAIDLRALRKEFLHLQAKAHPDLVPADKKKQAEAMSSRINEAYKTLQDPLRRAVYLLEMRGLEMGEGVSSDLDEAGAGVDQDTLMEVLEAREEIEEAETEEEVLALREVNEERVRGSVERIEELCGSDDWEGVKKESVRLRYWVNIREALEEWEPGRRVVLQH